MIHIAQWKTPEREMRLESSGIDYFLRRVKEIDKEFKKAGYDPAEVRKVHVVGEGRIRADIQRLIDGKKKNPFEKVSKDAPMHVGPGHDDKSSERAIAATGNTTDEELAHATTPPPLESVSSEESIAGDVILPEPKHKV